MKGIHLCSVFSCRSMATVGNVIDHEARMLVDGVVHRKTLGLAIWLCEEHAKHFSGNITTSGDADAESFSNEPTKDGDK